MPHVVLLHSHLQVTYVGCQYPQQAVSHLEALLDGVHVVVCPALIAAHEALDHDLLRAVKEQDEVWLGEHLCTEPSFEPGLCLQW